MKRAPLFRKRLATIAIALVFAVELGGCAAFILASAAGSLGYAGYQYAKSDAHAQAAPSAQPTTPGAQPTLSLNDIE